MQPISLSIKDVPPEFTSLRRGGLYWITCIDSEQADLLAAAALAGSPEVPVAVVAALGGAPESMLTTLAADAGPGRCVLYRAVVGEVRAAVQGLRRDLSRAAGLGPAFCIAKLPLDAVDAMPDAALAAWCRGLAEWAAFSGSTVLLLGHGDANAATPRLLPMDRSIDGIAQLLPQRGGDAYFAHYWRSSLGVVASREFHLRREAEGLVRYRETESAKSSRMFDDADRDLHLAEAAVLDGAPPLSPAWHVYDDWNALMAHALQSRAATVMFAISENDQVDELARLLYRLRRERGNAMKLVVRETAPCLRYVDERVLLDCGANLVVPADAPLARFLTQLDALQGQHWAGPLPEDPQAMIRARHPPEVFGVVSPVLFRQLALELVGRRIGAAENLALALQPVPGVRPEHALKECRIRRRGDLACAYKGEVWVFLFACRADGIESALGNMFRLPWREVFEGYRRLAEYHVAEMQPLPFDPAFDAVSAVPRGGAEEDAEADVRIHLRPIRLGQRR